MYSRYDKYMPFIESGSAIIPIPYIAEVLGISCSDAICDLQEMAALGYIGNGAYINYKDCTLVLKPFGAQETQSPPKSASRSTAFNKKSARNSGSRKTPVMIFFGMVAAISGISSLGGYLDILSYYFSWAILTQAAVSLLVTAAGAGVVAYAFYDKKRSARIEKYIEILDGMPRIKLSRLAEYAMIPIDTVKKDVDHMLKKDILGAKAHLSSDRSELLFFYEEEEASEKTSEKKQETKVEDRYDEILKEIRKLDDDIENEPVSERIRAIEDITRKIFALVREHPEKESEIKTFMSYYLPTTLKLLRSYSLFERQGIKGENIDSTLSDIERILDTLVSGFSGQLDRMFKSDALDISADIEVLESMMSRDGLSGGSAFQIKPDKKQE